MEGEANVEVSVTVATGEFPPPTMMTATQPPRLREAIDQVRFHASWIASFAAQLESTVVSAVETRSSELRLAEEKAIERLKEAEKSQEAAKRKSLELEARENEFELLVKKEIELAKSEKAVVEAKLKELEEREVEFESLGSYVEERVIQVRKVEEEIEERRKEFEAKEKDIEECLLRFRLREKGFGEQLAEFKLKQTELQVRSSELECRENQFKEMESNYELRLRDKEKKLDEQFKTLDQRIKAVELREKVIEQNHMEVESEGKKLAEWNKDMELKQSDLQVRSSELDVRENQLKEIESNHEWRLRNKEKKLEKQFKKLEERIKAAELNEKLLEQKHKESESEDKKRVEWKKDLELKQSELQVCLNELDVREKQFKEQNSNDELRLREKEKKLEEQFKMLDQQIKAVELREKLLEQKHKEVECEANRLAEWKKNLELKERESELRDNCSSGMKVYPLDSSLDQSSEANVRFCVTMNGKGLQIFLNQRSKDNDSLKDEIETALKLSSEPAKLVLDAMQGFYPPHLKEGDIEFEEGVIRKSCIMLLEQLTKMSPEIEPIVRKEAMKLACDWMTMTKCDVDHSLEVLALLQLMAAYGLASTFEDDEIVSWLCVIAHHSQAPRLLQDLGFTKKICGVILKLNEKKHQAEAYRLVSAFKLHNEFPSLSLLKDDVDSAFAPLIENKSAAAQCSGAKRSWADACADVNQNDSNLQSAVVPLIENKSAPVPAQCNEAKPSWADACGDGNQNDSTDPDQATFTSANLPAQQPEISNLPDQKPERALFDDKGRKNHLPVTFGHSGADSGKVFSLFVPECLEKGDTTLKSLCSKIQSEELYCREVGLYLRLASDPAESVLSVVKDPSSFSWSWGNGQVKFAYPEHGLLILLDHMRRNPYLVSENVGREAMSFAVDWKSELVAAKQMKDDGIQFVCFMLFLAAYKLDFTLDLDDLFSLFRTSDWCLNVTKLFRALGFDNLITKFIEYLMRNKRARHALQCINLSSLLEKSPTVKRLVSSYLFKRSKVLHDPKTQDDEIGDINKELHVWKALLKPVADRNLVERCRAYITFLEKRKEKKVQAEKKSKAIGIPWKSEQKPNNTPSLKSQDGRANKRCRVVSSLSTNEN